MTNRKTVAAYFVEIMAELSQNAVVPGAAVQVIAALKGVPEAVKDAASEISMLLLSGCRFSSACTACSAAEFSEQDISLLLCAEETGNFARAFRFLAAEKKRKKQAVSRLFTSALYPLIVVFLVVVGSAAILLCADMLLPLASATLDNAPYRTGVRIGLISANLFLCTVIAGFMYAARKILDSTSLHQVFSLLDFLCSSGIDLPRAVACSISGIRADHKLSVSLSRVLADLRDGIPFVTAFLSAPVFPATVRYQLELASLGGKTEAIFAHIVEALEAGCEKQRAVFIQIAEPAMLCTAGVYMLILLQTAIMPLITNYGVLL
jgi:type II secretory pathway component PulF